MINGAAVAAQAKGEDQITITELERWRHRLHGADSRLGVQITFLSIPGIEDRGKFLFKLFRGNLPFHVGFT
jgi:hypothetical protein